MPIFKCGPFFAAAIAALRPAKPEPQIIKSNSTESTILRQTCLGRDKYVVIVRHDPKSSYISLVISLVMISEWFQRVGSSVPRGFSRYFILELLKKKEQTGKEIIDYAVEQSNGIWKPSPGLIYPLLGRLLDEGLIQETKDGKYQLTKKGAETAQDVDKVNDIVKKQLDVLFRLGNVGRFVAMDLLEKISSMGAILSSNVANMTTEETEKYRKFLQEELKKIDAKDVKKKGKEIKIE